MGRVDAAESSCRVPVDRASGESKTRSADVLRRARPQMRGAR